MVFDSNLQLRTLTTSLTQDETGPTVEIGGTPIDGLAVVIDIPRKDVGDQFHMLLQHSTNGSAWSDLLTIETTVSVATASTVPFKIVRRFFTPLKYVRLNFDLTGTNPDFGAAKARIGDRDTWNRAAVGFQTTTP